MVPRVGVSVLPTKSCRRALSNPLVELTAKQRNHCLVPVMLRMPAVAHLQRYSAYVKDPLCSA